MKLQYWSINRLPGMTRSQVELLAKNNITNTKQLLELTQNRESKQKLASKLQLNQKYINKWVAMADLARLPSIGTQYCGLLLHAGIISTARLSQTPFYLLHRQIVRLQVATLRRKDLSPSIEQTKRWVEEAKTQHNTTNKY